MLKGFRGTQALLLNKLLPKTQARPRLQDNKDSMII